jgi:arginase
MDGMNRRWSVLGVPSSAGAHTPGLEKGPAALRAAGLVTALRDGGFDVDDWGDVPGFRWRPDLTRPHGQNASAVAAVARDTAAGVGAILAAGRVPFVLGGDCSITLGVVAGFVAAGRPPALVYMDGGPDLYTPDTRANGNLDAMGLAHMLALPGHLPEVAAAGPRVPLITADLVVSYGDALPENGDDPEAVLLTELGIARVTAREVRAGAGAAAARAVAVAEAASTTFVVHFDVDVLRFAAMPIADVPDSGDEPRGLSLDEATQSLAAFVASPRFGGLVLTEVNPDHAPEPATLREFATAVAAAVAH